MYSFVKFLVCMILFSFLGFVVFGCFSPVWEIICCVLVAFIRNSSSLCTGADHCNQPQSLVLHTDWSTGLTVQVMPGSSVWTHTHLHCVTRMNKLMCLIQNIQS